MTLVEQVDLFSIPVEMYAGTGRHKSTRQRLLERAGRWLGCAGDPFEEQERKLELEAILAAKEAAQAGDCQREERILEQYARAAQERRMAREASRSESRWHGNVGLVKRALARGVGT